MPIPSASAKPIVNPHRWSSASLTKRIPFIVRVAMLISVFLALVMLCLGITVRTNPTAKVIEPPPELLLGKQRFPSGADCEGLHDGRFLCHVVLNGSDIALTYDGVSYRILYTFVSTPDQTLGNLMAAWGTPTGFTRTDQTMLVFWSTRTAYLAPCSFQPESHVKFVGYSADEAKPLPWRGFIRQDYGCSAISGD